MNSETSTALTAVKSVQFAMPRFGNRSHHLKQMLSEISKDQADDVIGNTETNTSKAIVKIADNIGTGAFTLEPEQHDVTGKLFLNNYA